MSNPTADAKGKLAFMSRLARAMLKEEDTDTKTKVAAYCQDPEFAVDDKADSPEQHKVKVQQK